jgi:hypothetical protein
MKLTGKIFTDNTNENKKGLEENSKPLTVLVAGSGFEPETFGL